MWLKRLLNWFYIIYKRQTWQTNLLTHNSNHEDVERELKWKWFILVKFFWNLAYTLCYTNNEKSSTVFSKMEHLRLLKRVKKEENDEINNSFFYFLFWNLSNILQYSNNERSFKNEKRFFFLTKLLLEVKM